MVHEDEFEFGFDHAIVHASVTDVLRILRSLKNVHPHEVFSDITRRLEWIDLRRIFVTAHGDNASVVWTAPGDTELLKRLSQHVATPVRWVYADEPTRSSAYLEYRNGHLEEMILDPRQTWESGTVSGEVLMGRGPRTYPTIYDFLEHLQDRYNPPDTQWCYPAWIIPDTREEFLRTPQVFAWSIELLFESNGHRITFHGPVPDELQRESS